jgi:hypothetical protein
MSVRIMNLSSLSWHKDNTTSRMAEECAFDSQPPLQWMLGVLSSGVKWPEREGDHPPPSSDQG